MPLGSDGTKVVDSEVVVASKMQSRFAVLGYERIMSYVQPTQGSIILEHRMTVIYVSSMSNEYHSS